MTWNKLKRLKILFIGNHSHSHDYLVNGNFEEFKIDIETSIKLFKKI